MVRAFVRWLLGGLFLAAALMQLLLAVSGTNERIGDRVQVALPLLGAVCAVARRDFGPYAARFAGSMGVVHGLKNGLGGTPLNQRPKGGRQGFPSGHTAAAAYGASYLVRTCAAALPGIGPALVVAAGFVAGSRIEAGRHDLVQVIAGAVIGIGFDRAGRGAATRRRLRATGRRLAQASAASVQAARLAASRLASAAASRPVVATQSTGAAATRARKSIGGLWTSLRRGRPARM